MTRDVFISYSNRDEQTANAVCSHLEASGISCWIAPRDMDVGGQTGYGATIIEAISNCSMMVVILSHHSNGSVQVMREVERAVAKGISILPFQIEPMDLSPDLEFFLSATHRLNATKGPLSQHIEALIQRICQLRISTQATARSREHAMQATLPRMQTRQRDLRWLALGLPTLLLAVLIWLGQPNEPSVAAVESAAAVGGERGSIAVLPFVNLSDDKSNEYFSDGVSEEILNALGKQPGLRVASRTSSFSFKDGSVAIDEIARRLRVAHVLEGSVRRMRDSVRITAKLIDTRTDRQVWSEDFDRNLNDIFAVQAEIARAVATALELRLGSAVNRRQPTDNTRAYDYYLFGLSEWHRRTIGGFNKAAEHFDAAIREDSSYAEAWAGLALAHIARPVFDVRVEPIQAGRLGIQAARRALALDSTLAQAHTAYGWLLAREEFKWQEGLAELRRAVQLNPSDATARAYLGMLLSQLGRFDEALQQIDQAVMQDPHSAFGHQLRGLVLNQAGRQEESLIAFRATTAIEPDNIIARGNLARLHLAAGQYDSARSELHRVADLASYPHAQEMDTFIDALRAGKPEDARQILRLWEQTRPFPDYILATLYAAMRDRAGTLRMLRRSADKREPLLHQVRSDPDFAWLRRDPEYRALLRRMKFPAE